MESSKDKTNIQALAWNQNRVFFSAAIVLSSRNGLIIKIN